MINKITNILQENYKSYITYKKSIILFWLILFFFFIMTYFAIKNALYNDYVNMFGDLVIVITLVVIMFFLMKGNYGVAVNTISLVASITNIVMFLLSFNKYSDIGINLFVFWFFYIVVHISFFSTNRLLFIISILFVILTVAFHLIISFRGTNLPLYTNVTLSSNIIGSFMAVCVISYFYKTIMDDALNVAEKNLENTLEMNKSLESIVLERTKILEEERKRLLLYYNKISYDLSIAKKIQDQLIPKPDPIEYIYSIYKPMEHVGGDFYDFITFENSKEIGIFISDVSGHGVPAALITSMIKTTLLQSGKRKENPAELLQYINDVLKNYTGGHFITAFYCIYNPETRELTYSNAGHYQPFIITEDHITQLQGGSNTAIAMFSNNFLMKHNKQYLNYTEKLPQKSKLLLFTDGLTEACSINDGDRYFEYANMLDIFKENLCLPCKQFTENLFNKLIEFRGTDSFEDDVCIVCLDVN